MLAPISQTIVWCSVADPHHIDAEPYPTFHFDADPDPDPAVNKGSKPWKRAKIVGSYSLHVGLSVKFTRIRIQFICLMRSGIQLTTFQFDADPDPQRWFDVDGIIPYITD